MRSQDFGFEVEDRYILHIDPAMAGYRVEELSSLYRKLRDSLGAIPGVSRVSFALYSPMEGDNWGETVYIEGQPPPPAGSYENGSSWLRVSDGYFETVGTRIVKGRGITEQDTASSRNVAVVNETFARKFFKDGDPIGKRFGDLDPKYAGNFEIVGVTEDTQYREATREIPPTFFLPEAQKVLYDEPRFQAFENRSHYLGAVVIQTEGALTGFEPQVRRAISQVNPDLAVIDFKTFAAQVEANFAQQAMLAKLTSLFGLVALALASVGLYGVTAYTVERRTGEIGIRMALGADASRVLKLVLRGAFAQIGIGLLIGVPATIATGYAMTTQLFGVKPYSPGVLLTTTLVLSSAALVAALVPARRAAMLSAIRALRTE
jgi:predicted permease